MSAKTKGKLNELLGFPHLKTGGIGRGWAPEEAPDPVKELAAGLLKELIDEIFKASSPGLRAGGKFK